MLSAVVFAGILGIPITLMLMLIMSKSLKKNRYLSTIQNKQWFKNPWTIGLIVFGYNAALFGFSVLLFSWRMYVNFFFITDILAFISVFLSITFWYIVGSLWEGTMKSRSLAAFIGSSFYFILIGFAVKRMIDISNHVTGDGFMAMLGVVILMIIASVAALLNFTIIAIPRKNNL